MMRSLRTFPHPLCAAEDNRSGGVRRALFESRCDYRANATGLAGRLFFDYFYWQNKKTLFWRRQNEVSAQTKIQNTTELKVTSRQAIWCATFPRSLCLKRSCISAGFRKDGVLEWNRTTNCPLGGGGNIHFTTRTAVRILPEMRCNQNPHAGIMFTCCRLHPKRACPPPLSCLSRKGGDCRVSLRQASL
jgi:hypothetical protein